MKRVFFLWIIFESWIWGLFVGGCEGDLYWELIVSYEISNFLKPIQNFWRHLSDMTFPIIIIHTRICMKFDESGRQTWSDRFRRELVWLNEMAREDRKINSTRLRETKRKEDKEKIMGIKEGHQENEILWHQAWKDHDYVWRIDFSLRIELTFS